MSFIDILIKKQDRLVDEIIDKKSKWTITTRQEYSQYNIWKHGTTLNLTSCFLDVVKFAENAITQWESYRDVISFEFSGCVMAKYMLCGKIYVCHIYCADIQHANNDRRWDWRTFVVDKKKEIQSFCMFRPGNEDLDYVRRDVEIWGVISENRCYSVFVDAEKRRLLCIKEHTYGILLDNYYPIISCKQLINDYSTVSTMWNNFWMRKQGKIIFLNDNT